ncbi:hypothetical protein [Halorubrum sp. Atlit-26R]|uniref:hypothetical protein n=1 Tax=Halorubrum sp. Atlit-26R TaxID=2282128 RepID=UPI000EF1D40E|nr:hypothetical protein [Halorubrum sp. Atlit-26R]RLM62561.1 hypothetical protein DVK07_18620 [Halorubrum sp. Atlit-26R]
MRERLRERLITEIPEGPNEPDDTDEEILNVIREELQSETGLEYLTTGEIAEGISIQSTQTGKRLNTLAEEGRVKRRRAGQTDMWTLAENETRTVVDPQLTEFAKTSSQLREVAGGTLEMGKGVVALGLVLMLLALSNVVAGLPLLGFDWNLVLAVGYLVGMIGGLLVIASGVFSLVGQYTPTVAKSLLLE